MKGTRSSSGVSQSRPYPARSAKGEESVKGDRGQPGPAVGIGPAAGLLRLVLFIVGACVFFKGEFFIACLLIYAAIWPETLHD